MRYTPVDELNGRLRRLQQALAAQELDGALIIGKANLFYYSGTAQQAHLWVPASGEPVLMVRKVLSRAQRDCSLPNITGLQSFRDLAPQVGTARRIGIELDILPVSLFTRYQEALPAQQFSDIGLLTRQLRMRKSPYEIAAIRRVAPIVDAMYQALVTNARVGISELDLFAAVENAGRKAGHEGVVYGRGFQGGVGGGQLLVGESAFAFGGIESATAGEGLSPAVPMGPCRRTVQRGDPIHFDFLVASGGYVIDQTRAVGVGDLHPDLRRAYGVAQEIHRAAVAAARPGTPASQLWDIAVQISQDAGLRDHFMGWGENRVRFVGHGVGVEADELPVLAAGVDPPLEEGVVIALEPKFFFAGRGMVGLENTYVVTAAGLQKLNTSADDLVVVPG